jgi:hypothetical protein
VDVKAMAGVHTADDERASWVNLLSILQREEADSRKWDEDMRNKTPPRTPVRAVKPPDYTLVVGLQRKTRSWDFMPGSITKVGAQIQTLSGIGTMLTILCSHTLLRQSVT